MFEYEFVASSAVVADLPSSRLFAVSSAFTFCAEFTTIFLADASTRSPPSP